MPNGQPNQLANLRPPWQPGTQPKPSTNYVERMISRGHKAAPQAMRLITQAMHDRELPMSLRLRCAEYIVDKTWPKPPPGAYAGVLGAGGVEFLELRFVAPGQQPIGNVGESVGQIIDAEPEARDIKDMGDE